MHLEVLWGMSESEIRMEQLRQELTEQSGGKPDEFTSLEFLLGKGVIVTAWVDTSQQRYLCGEIEGHKFKTKQARHFSYAMLKELVDLATPSINEQESRKNSP